MGHETPYSPMHAPRKNVSFDDMKRILAKHALQSCEANLLKAVQSPQLPKAAEEIAPQVQSSKSVRWRKIETLTFESDKGPVLRVEGDKYIVFDRVTTSEHTAQVIGRFGDAQTAKDFVRLLP